MTRVMGWRNFAPGLALLTDYRRTWLRGDVLAGITVAAYLVPQVMAYAALAGLPPVSGLWASLAPLVIYAFLGSSRQLSVGPESTTALMTAIVLAPFASGDPGATPLWQPLWRCWSVSSALLQALSNLECSPICFPIRCSSAIWVASVSPWRAVKSAQ